MKKQKKPEKKFCPTCGYPIKDAFALRCPRCFTSLLPSSTCNGNCSKCMAGKNN